MAFVDRERLINTLCHSPICYMDGTVEMSAVLDIAEGMPVEEVAVVRHGHWVDLRDEENETRAGYCSACGWESHVYEDDVIGMPYCPNCGARMDVAFMGNETERE